MISSSRCGDQCRGVLGGRVVCVLDTDGEEAEARDSAERRGWDLAEGSERVRLLLHTGGITLLWTPHTSENLSHFSPFRLDFFTV